jgi:hypothetical protein
MGTEETQHVDQTRSKCISGTDGALNDAQQLLREGIARIEAGEDVGQVLTALDALFKFKKIVKSISVVTRDYHDAIKALGKVCHPLTLCQKHTTTWCSMRHAVCNHIHKCHASLSSTCLNVFAGSR